MPLRILLIRLSALGDVVVTTPVSRALREAFPDAHLTWVVERRAADLLLANPYLDEVVPWDRARGTLPLRALRSLRRELLPRRFDWAIDFQGNLRSALVARCSGARRVVGNVGAKEHADILYHVRVPRRRDDLSSRQRCLDLLRPLGVESTDRRMVLNIQDSEKAAAEALVRQKGIAEGSQLLALVPQTTWPQKHWFDENWAQLAVMAADRLGLTPILLGGPADVGACGSIAAATKGVAHNLAGKAPLKVSAALLARARAAVSVDTALMHAAVAVGTPTVGLAGASYWPGFQDYERFALVREALACSPCLHRPTCDGRFDCMRAITPERVLQALEPLMVC